MRLLFLYYLILKDRLFVLREPNRLRRVSAMIPYGTFRAVRENNQSVFILIGLIGEKPGVTFIASTKLEVCFCSGAGLNSRGRKLVRL